MAHTEGGDTETTEALNVFILKAGGTEGRYDGAYPPGEGEESVAQR